MSRELYEKEHWFDRRFSYEFITNIRKALVQLTSSYIRRYKLPPFDYYSREATIVSHLAAAADRAGYFTIQEHPPVLSDGKENSRPDMFIRYGLRPNDTCVFEAKRVDVDPTLNYLETDFSIGIRLISRDWEKMAKYAANVAGHQCAIVGMKIDVSISTISSEWIYETRDQQRQSYYRAINRIYSHLVGKIGRMNDAYSVQENGTIVPNFYWSSCSTA